MKRKILSLILSIEIVCYSSQPCFATDPHAEEFFWQAPQTVHSYKKTSDLHNIIPSVAALTEIELIRIADSLMSLPFKRNLHPLSRSFDDLHDVYHQIHFLPEHFPMLRVEQLLDALQIRQSSLSDIRILLISPDSVANGRGVAFSSIMQTRVFKLLLLVEDLVDDADQIVMFPVNGSVSLAKREKVRMKSVGYAGTLLGILRRNLFEGVRRFDKAIVNISSGFVYRIEDIHNASIRWKKRGQNKRLILYLRMPASIYRSYGNFFEKKAKYNYAALPTGWRDLKSQEIEIPALAENRSNLKNYEKLDPEEYLLIAVEARSWKKVPMILRDYIITEDEFENFISV